MLKENKHCIPKTLKRDDNVQGEDRRERGRERGRGRERERKERRKKVKIQLINKSLILEDNVKNI